jgi:hypothetical protein
MAKRKCPRNKQQDGVCGCPSFWKRSKASLTSNNNNKKDLSTSAKSSFATLVAESERRDSCGLCRRKRQKREDSAFPQAGIISPSLSKSLSYMCSGLLVGGCDGKKQQSTQVNTQVQRSGWATKEDANKPGRILVEYDLPTGAQRLDWDTDEVRRMVGEIA